MAMGTDVGTERAVSAINVTPLIDVLLVLLIIFMVIVPLTPKGLSSEAPRPEPQSTPSSDAVVLQVAPDSRGGLSYRINQSPINKADIVPALSRIFSTRQNRVVFVKGDASVTYARIAELIDMAHTANIDQVGLITARMQQAQ
jgi:biopolymer transport protein ExbD/biopolymer transport protein TolR